MQDEKRPEGEPVEAPPASPRLIPLRFAELLEEQRRADDPGQKEPLRAFLSSVEHEGVSLRSIVRSIDNGDPLIVVPPEIACAIDEDGMYTYALLIERYVRNRYDIRMMLGGMWMLKR